MAKVKSNDDIAELNMTAASASRGLVGKEKTSVYFNVAAKKLD